MSDKRITSTDVKTNTKTSTDPTGNTIKTITTITTENFSDGSSVTKTNVKTEKTITKRLPTASNSLVSQKAAEVCIGGDILQLTATNFESSVIKPQESVLVTFYAPWCGHCVRLTPELVKTAEALKGKIVVASLDCTVHKSAVMNYRTSVTGYPTIMLFQAGRKSTPEKYLGQRTSQDIVNWISKKA